MREDRHAVSATAADRTDEGASPTDGAKNYMTLRGYEQLRDELRQLTRVERPKVVDVVSWAAANGDRSENGDYIYGKRRLRQIHRRIRFLAQRLGNHQLRASTQQEQRDQVVLIATL